MELSHTNIVLYTFQIVAASAQRFFYPFRRGIHPLYAKRTADRMMRFQEIVLREETVEPDRMMLNSNNHYYVSYTLFFPVAKGNVHYTVLLINMDYLQID